MFRYRNSKKNIALSDMEIATPERGTNFLVKFSRNVELLKGNN